MSVEENLQAIKDGHEAFNAQDGDRFFELYAESVVYYGPDLPEPVKGRAALREVFEGAITAFPDIRSKVEAGRLASSARAPRNVRVPSPTLSNATSFANQSRAAVYPHRDTFLNQHLTLANGTPHPRLDAEQRRGVTGEQDRHDGQRERRETAYDPRAEGPSIDFVDPTRLPVQTGRLLQSFEPFCEPVHEGQHRRIAALPLKGVDILRPLPEVVSDRGVCALSLPNHPPVDGVQGKEEHDHAHDDEGHNEKDTRARDPQGDPQGPNPEGGQVRPRQGEREGTEGTEAQYGVLQVRLHPERPNPELVHPQRRANVDPHEGAQDREE